MNSLKPTSATADFLPVLKLIREKHTRALQAVNFALIDTYWAVGELLSARTAESGWGRGTVQELSDWLAATAPELRGYSASNLWRMKQFYEEYHNDPILAPLVRELPWTQNLIILSQTNSHEEREFYLRSSIRAKWSKRDLTRQIESGTFERTMISDRNLAPTVRELPQDAVGIFKDSYLLDFLALSEPHSEASLQKALVHNLRSFLLELGEGFAFVGEKVRLQVGSQDFELDLLFFHRDLQCLVAFELKTSHFQPSHLGQLSFYLEALDRLRKRPHENPTIGVLLCRSKDDEVVEFAMSRHLSPALVARYETRMIPKETLQAKLREWAMLFEQEDDVHSKSDDKRKP